jgi:hypothetical protein
MSLAASLQQPSAWDQATTRLLELLEPDPPPLEPARRRHRAAARPAGAAGQQPRRPHHRRRRRGRRQDVRPAAQSAEAQGESRLRRRHLPPRDDAGESRGRHLGREREALSPLRRDPNLTTLKWAFPSGMSVQFAHMQHAKDRFDWDGSQIPCIGFDQLESFEEIQFWYMFSRNRSVCGVKPYVIATCNPVPADDPSAGGSIASSPGGSTRTPACRSRARRQDALVRAHQREIHWADAPDALRALPGPRRRRPAEVGDVHPRHARRQQDPAAEGPELPRQPAGAALRRARAAARRQLEGPRERREGLQPRLVPHRRRAPRHAKRVRYWDKAGTEGGGKRTAGVRLAGPTGCSTSKTSSPGSGVAARARR